MNEVMEKKELERQSVCAQDAERECREWLEATGTRLTDKQMSLFLLTARQWGLSPAKREIYAVAYKENFNIIVGYETYIKRAERTGLLDGWQCECDGKTATCTIWRKDRTHPFAHSVDMAEYNTGKSLWASKPKTMLKKVAIAQAFRLCFSDDLGGMPYISEETGESEPIDVSPHPEREASGTWRPTDEDREMWRTKIAALKSAGGDAEMVASYNARVAEARKREDAEIFENVCKDLDLMIEQMKEGK